MCIYYLGLWLNKTQIHVFKINNVMEYKHKTSWLKPVYNEEKPSENKYLI